MPLASGHLRSATVVALRINVEDCPSVVVVIVNVKPRTAEVMAELSKDTVVPPSVVAADDGGGMVARSGPAGVDNACFVAVIVFTSLDVLVVVSGHESPGAHGSTEQHPLNPFWHT